MHAVLHAPNHAPKAGKPWRYSIVVTDAAGHPLSGIIDVQFTFAGQVVGKDIPPTHKFTQGAFQEVLTFPARAVGEPISLQLVIHTTEGSTTVNWPVTVVQ